MSIHSSDKSKTSVKSDKSQKSLQKKSLSEKIKDLGISLKPQRREGKIHKIQFVVVKLENNQTSHIAIMTPNLNLEQITYYQPELNRSESTSERSVYKIEKFETNSTGPKEIRKISDIEVKSFKPTKKMKFRRKKRRASIVNKVQAILNKGESPPTRDPSEESIEPYSDIQDVVTKEISDLPENILQKIFFFLTPKERMVMLPRVCKSWYYILKDPVFWTSMDFVGFKIPTDVIIDLLRRYPSLESLNLTSVPNIVEILQELCRCNHDIKQLRVRDCDVSTQDFGRIILHVVSCCTKLEVLDIKGMPFQSERFYVELGRLQNLKSINLSGNGYLRSQDLITLSVNCRALQELKVLDTNLDSSLGITLKDNEMVFVMSHLQSTLTTLKIDMYQLGSSSYQAIIKCPQLQCLALKSCLLLSGDVFRQFTALKNLKKLKITRGFNLKAEDFQYVFGNENMRNIVELDINGCWNVGEIGLKAITNRLSLLKALSLKNCKSIKKNDLAHLSNCPKLMSLNIAHTEVDPDNLELLHNYAKNLKELVVSSSVPYKSLRLLKKHIPSLIIKLSFSEYQKDERILNDI